MGRREVSSKRGYATYLADEDTMYNVFMKLIDWYAEHGRFSSEAITQDKDCQLTALELLAEIADEDMQFEE